MTTINEIKDRLNAVAFAGRSYAGADRAAFVEEAERRGLVIRSGPSPSVLHALRLVKVTGKVSKPDDTVEEPCPPHTLRRCPACGVHIYDLTDVEGDAK